MPRGLSSWFSRGGSSESLVSGRVSTPPGEVMGRLVGPSGRLVVLDCETTGLYSRDRVVEVALVTIGAGGEVIDRWESLVNPCRDVGPTSIHGITGAAVADAPEFADLAGAIAVRVDGAVLAAHNLPFDVRMIGAEFARQGVEFDAGQGIDTLRLARGKLGDACREHGIEIGSAHRALDDALATAKLLLKVASRASDPVVPARFRTIPPVQKRTVVRDAVRGSIVVMTDRIPSVVLAVRRVPLPPEEEADALGYLDLLERVLTDLRIEPEEEAELQALAEAAGLQTAERRRLHEQYLARIIDEVLADGQVTAEEYDQLVRVAAALGLDQDVVHRRTRAGRTMSTELTLSHGMRLCITGDVEGSSKEELKRRLRRAGFDVDDTVTKRTELLVAADPSSQSGKADKARQYGIPIVATSVMSSAVAGDRVTVTVLEVERLAAQVCERCGATWAAPSRAPRRARLCEDCRSTSGPKSRSAPDAQNSASISTAETSVQRETLVCGVCGREWERDVARGRKPKACPDCRT